MRTYEPRVFQHTVYYRSLTILALHLLLFSSEDGVSIALCTVQLYMSSNAACVLVGQSGITLAGEFDRHACISIRRYVDRIRRRLSVDGDGERDRITGGNANRSICNGWTRRVCALLLVKFTILSELWTLNSEDWDSTNVRFRYDRRAGRPAVALYSDWFPFAPCPLISFNLTEYDCTLAAANLMFRFKVCNYWPGHA